MNDIEYTPRQIRAAKRAQRALNLLRDDGLCLIQHSSTGEIYAVPQHMADSICGTDTYKFLNCGRIDDAGDW